MAGQYFDAETGLHHNYHRYYDPKTGRYITPDPIGLEGGINPFGYTGQNPINRTDPLGLEYIDSWRQNWPNSNNSHKEFTWAAHKEIVKQAFSEAVDPRTYTKRAKDLLFWPSRHPEEAIMFIAGGEFAGALNRPNMAKPFLRGSTGKSCPGSLQEQWALQRALRYPKLGNPIPVRGGMADKRWPGNEGWVKMRQNSYGVEIHYVRNIKTGAVDDFKIIE